MGKDRRVKVPPLKEEGKWRRFFFGSSNSSSSSSNNNRRGVRAGDAAVDAGDGAAAGGGGRKRARLGDSVGAVPEEEQAQPSVAAAEGEGEIEQREFDEEEGEVVMEEAAAGDGGKEEKERDAAAIVAGAGAVPVVGPMKEVFEGPHAPGTSLVLQFDQVCVRFVHLRTFLATRERVIGPSFQDAYEVITHPTKPKNPTNTGVHRPSPRLPRPVARGQPPPRPRAGCLALRAAGAVSLVCILWSRGIND